MKIIGITGGIGAGKSTVLDYLKNLKHTFATEADKVGHLVMEPGGICYERVIALFGKQIIKSDKSIDRAMVSDVVFGNEEMRRRLDDIMHPAIKQYILDQINVEKKKETELFVVEAALLLEDHYDDFCDEIWYIYADEEVRIDRLIKTRGYSREKALSIISRQKSDDFYREHADVIIENNGDLNETYRQIDKGLETL